jgi:hypothetical protein
MKKPKINLSKTGWIILSVGVFVVILGGLGVTYAQQIREKGDLEEELALTDIRLEKLDIAGLQQQESQLEAQLEDVSAEYDVAKDQMLEVVESIEVTEKCYQVSHQSGVEIYHIGTTDVREAELGGVSCYTISVLVRVRGDLPDIVDFIVNLNDSFSTGYVEIIQLHHDEESADPYATIHLVVYSYVGE